MAIYWILLAVMVVAALLLAAGIDRYEEATLKLQRQYKKLKRRVKELEKRGTRGDVQ